MQEEEQRDSPDHPGGEDKPEGVRRVSEAGRAGLEPANNPEAQKPASGHARQGDDDTGRADTAEGDEDEPGPDTEGEPRKRRRGHRHWDERERVDQAECEERETDRPDPSRAMRIPPHDRHPNGLVEAAGKRDAHHRRAAAGSGEGKRTRALTNSEETPPAEGLEAEGDQEE